MKIFLVLNHFLPHQIAGTEVYSYALAKNLKNLGLDINVVVPNYGKDISEMYEYEDITVHQYAEPSVVDRALIMGKRKADGLSYFESLIKKEKPDIIHFHELAGSNGISLNHIRIAKKFGSKIVMTLHLVGYTCMTSTLIYMGKFQCQGIINERSCAKCYLQSRGYQWVYPLITPISSFFDFFRIDTTNWQHKLGTALGTKMLVKKRKTQIKRIIDYCDRAVVLTDWYKKILLMNGITSAKIEHIPQALPFKNFTTLSKNKILPQLPLNIIFVGRISRFKGLHLMLEAIKEFDVNQVKFDIYGQTNEPEYEKFCKKISLGKLNIRWMGALQIDKVITTMSHYHMLCLCSTICEMSPLVIQEAFAAGIPVIASNVYGNAEQIQHLHNGLLFKFNDVESLREQIQLCIDNPILIQQMAQNIKPPSGFSEVAAAYYKLYHKILSDS